MGHYTLPYHEVLANFINIQTNCDRVITEIKTINNQGLSCLVTNIKLNTKNLQNSES